MKQPELGDKIAEIRKNLSMTQDDLAYQTGVSIRTVQRIEQGEVTPRLSTLKLLSEALDYNFNGISTNGRIDKTILFALQLSNIFIFIPFPIVVLIWNNSMSKTLEVEAKRAINFQIIYLLFVLLSLGVLLLGTIYYIFFFIGSALLILTPIVGTIICIRNMLLLNTTLKAKYLFEFKFIK